MSDLYLDTYIWPVYFILKNEYLKKKEDYYIPTIKRTYLYIKDTSRLDNLRPC